MDQSRRCLVSRLKFLLVAAMQSTVEPAVTSHDRYLLSPVYRSIVRITNNYPEIRSRVVEMQITNIGYWRNVI